MASYESKRVAQKGAKAASGPSSAEASGSAVNYDVPSTTAKSEKWESLDPFAMRVKVSKGLPDTGEGSGT